MNQEFMSLAIKQAKLAFKNDEIPIGAVIVKNDKVLATAYNKRNKLKSAVAHAEILAIEKSCKKLGDWRLNDCEMYVTCVPCPMCAGAIVNSRLRKVFYGAENENSVLFEKIMKESSLNHKTEFEGGILKNKCSKLLSDFFNQKR